MPRKTFTDEPLSATDIADVDRILAGKVPTIKLIASKTVSGIMFVDLEVSKIAETSTNDNDEASPKKSKHAYRYVVLGQDPKKAGRVVMMRHEEKAVTCHGVEFAVDGDAKNVNWCSDFQLTWGFKASRAKPGKRVGRSSTSHRAVGDIRERFARTLIAEITNDASFDKQDWIKIENIIKVYAKHKGARLVTFSRTPIKKKSAPKPLSPGRGPRVPLPLGSKDTDHDSEDDSDDEELEKLPIVFNTDEEIMTPVPAQSEDPDASDFGVNKAGHLSAEEAAEASELLKQLDQELPQKIEHDRVFRFTMLMQRAYPTKSPFNIGIVEEFLVAREDDPLLYLVDFPQFVTWWMVTKAEPPVETDGKIEGRATPVPELWPKSLSAKEIRRRRVLRAKSRPPAPEPDVVDIVEKAKQGSLFHVFFVGFFYHIVTGKRLGDPDSDLDFDFVSDSHKKSNPDTE